MSAADYLADLADNLDVATEVRNLHYALAPVYDHLFETSPVEAIVVDAPDQIYVERAGAVQHLADRRFPGWRAVSDAVKALADLAAVTIDDQTREVEFRLRKPLNVGVQALFQAHSDRNPVVLRIQKHPGARWPLDALVTPQGALSRPAADYLRAAVAARLNVLVCGPSGAGKTTLLNALVDVVPPHERVAVVEREAELTVRRPRAVHVESSRADDSGGNAVTRALRLRPDRIVLGACDPVLGPAWLSAAAAGCRGGLATIDADGPEQAMNLLEAAASSAFPAASPAVRRNIVASAVEVIVHLDRRCESGRRVVRQVCEVHPTREGAARLVALFEFRADVDPGAGSGAAAATGAGSRFVGTVGSPAAPGDASDRNPSTSTGECRDLPKK